MCKTTTTTTENQARLQMYYIYHRAQRLSPSIEVHIQPMKSFQLLFQVCSRVRTIMAERPSQFLSRTVHQCSSVLPIGIVV